jgi:chromosome segregation ATPase
MHSTTWTLAGAGLVFVTYVVKEIFSEQLKDVSGALSDAESLYTLHQDSDLLWIKLAKVETQVATVRDKVESASTPGAGTWVNRLHNAHENVKDLMTNARIWFEQTSRLVEKLSSRHKGLLLARDALANEIKNVQGEVEKLKLPTTPAEEAAQAALIVKVTTLQIKIGALAEEAQTTVRAAQHRAEIQYKWFTRLSYLLYAMGWGLALYAQLHGEELFKVG